MRVFVTGGTGFLGRRIVERLRQAGHAVTALSRDAKGDRALASLGADSRRGDLASIAELGEALDGHDVVIHAAAPVEIWGCRDRFNTTIVSATKALFEAATRQRVPRFIHISSEAVLQDRASLLDIDETAAYPAMPNSRYGEAKRDIEQWLRCSRNGPHVVILRPPCIWGAGDQISQYIADKARLGLFAWIDGGKIPVEMVHVDNVAEAVMCALMRGTRGGLYIITDDRPMMAKAFLKPLLAARGVHLTNRSVRGSMARPIGVGVETVWRTFGLHSTPPVSRFQLAFLGLPRRYRIDRAKAELGYRPVRSWDEGLAEVRAWHARRQPGDAE